MKNPTILILGHADSGKTTLATKLAQLLNLKYMDSSWFCAEHVVLPAMREHGRFYHDAKACHDDRSNCRELWRQIISAWCQPKDKLAIELLKVSDIYVGQRSLDEYRASKGMFDFIIYCDAGNRVQSLDPSMQIAYDSREHWLFNTDTFSGSYEVQLEQFVRVYNALRENRTKAGQLPKQPRQSEQENKLWELAFQLREYFKPLFEPNTLDNAEIDKLLGTRQEHSQFVKSKLKSEDATAEAIDTFNNDVTVAKPATLIHAVFGLVGEVGELSDCIKQQLIYGKELDTANLREELADIYFFWHAALIASGTTPEEIFTVLENKLNKRHTKGYSDAGAIAKADHQEQ